MSADLERRAALVFGAGISGLAAARLLLSRGIHTTLTARVETAGVNALVEAGVKWKAGDPVEVARHFFLQKPLNAFAVASPGIPRDAPELIRCTQAGFPVFGELELGAMFLSSRIIAVTGSKGKSSVVKLIADALSQTGVEVLPCGNYGLALSEVATFPKQPAVVVVECSSFQLEQLGSAFKPVSAVVLNVSPDHLDRHGTMEAYLDVKLNIFRNMDVGAQLLPSPGDDFYGLNTRYQARYQRMSVTFGCHPKDRWRYFSGIVTDAETGFAVDISGSYFDNVILGPAAAAACCLLSAEGLSAEQISSAFHRFVPLAHRMQVVAKSGGVTFIDDSKATSMAALLAGVRMAPKPVFLIAGGRLKEKISLTGKEVVTNGVKKAYLIGECMQEMASAWSNELPIELCQTLEVAVSRAFQEAVPGGSVLLSPGTASFDQFKNYEMRGDCFAEHTKNLIDQAENRYKKSKMEQ